MMRSGVRLSSAPLENGLPDCRRADFLELLDAELEGVGKNRGRVFSQGSTFGTTAPQRTRPDEPGLSPSGVRVGAEAPCNPPSGFVLHYPFDLPRGGRHPLLLRRVGLGIAAESRTSSASKATSAASSASWARRGALCGSCRWRSRTDCRMLRLHADRERAIL